MYTFDSHLDEDRAKDLPIVSFESFATDLNRGPKASFRRSFERNNRQILPNYSDLRLADVILTKSMKKNIVGDTISKRQRGLKYPADDASWTHAMIYVGQMHVAESVFLWHDIGRKVFLRSGIRIAPITTVIKNCHYRILRHRDLEREKYTVSRLEASNYAMLDYIADRRVYNVIRIPELATDGKVRRIGAKINIPAIKRSIICSEFVLECLAIGAGVHVERFFQLQQDFGYIYPADFPNLDNMREVTLSEVLVILDDIY